jgi:hypothetical protein
MNSGKFSRTMVEAFGPYTSHALAPMPEPIHPTDKVVLVACALGAVAVLFVLVLL